MRSTTSILALKYMPVSVKGGLRKSVGGFLKYIQHRDQHIELDSNQAFDAYARYVAHRDRTSPQGRVFGDENAATADHRKRLIEHVVRSTRGLEPKWALNRDGGLEDRQRAVYQFIFSPQDSRGLDLRLLARKAMSQLELDAGSAGMPPWFAAVHRNTRHHHVHIVLAARREIAPDKFSTLVITRERLRRMKDVIKRELKRQRRVERGFNAIGLTVDRLRLVARHYASQMERELEADLARQQREAWAR